MNVEKEKRSGAKQGLGKKLTRQVLGTCKNCGYMSSQDICKACMLLEGLNKNRPKMEIEIDVEDEEKLVIVQEVEKQRGLDFQHIIQFFMQI